MQEIEYKKSPIKAIRAKCIECFGGEVYQVKGCLDKNCPLYPYRFGKNPYREPKQYTDEQRAQIAERLALARTKKQENEIGE